ncbi:MAG: porin [Rhodoferax sp.]|nr:porin [Rhodoferax sp.]
MAQDFFCCDPATKTAASHKFIPQVFAKTCRLWCNSCNFLKQEVGPGIRISTGALCLTLEKLEMKKTLVAVAALAFIGAASAQSTVTLFGSIDASVGKNQLKQTGVFPGAVASDVGPNVNSGTQNGSRWGMRGTEDLGGGMSAIFNLTSGFNVDTGFSAQGGRLFGREAWVGLKGGFGQVTLGRQVTILANGPWAITGGYANYDAWANTTFNGGFGNAGSIAHDAVRKDNSLQYVTPAFGGFTGTFMWAPGENGIVNGANNSNYYSLGLGYVAGPLNVQFGYETDKVLNVAALTPSPVGRNQNQVALAATYNLGVATIGASIQRASLANFDDRGYALSVSAPLGPVTLDIEYAREKTDNPAGAQISEAKALNLRVNYPLSKRTKFYALLSDGKSTTNVVGAKQDLSRYQVGVRHVF